LKGCNRNETAGKATGKNRIPSYGSTWKHLGPAYGEDNRGRTH